MIILVGSKIDQSCIQSSLGKPEYSYYFLLQDFVPALQQLGTVIVIDTLEQVDQLYRHHQQQGQQVIYLSFTPPDQTPLYLDCPTCSVFAWEYSSLPDQTWDTNPQSDWILSLSQLQGTIATSRDALRLVQQALGADYPAISLPAPLWERIQQRLGLHSGDLDLGVRHFIFQGQTLDSPWLGLSADGLARKPEPPTINTPPSAWALSKSLLKNWWQEIRQPEPAAVPEQPPQSLSKPEPEPEPEPEPTIGFDVSGVVYTTILNPADNRKNWVEIITAFCWVFKHQPNATLIVKVTHHDWAYYRVFLLTILSRLAPFECRVIGLHGFLDDVHYAPLIAASTYYVNASSGEGLCLPLMEFLSAGKPVLAPTHTAMADYINPQLAFEIHCSAEPTCWIQDPFGKYGTFRQRLNWQSLAKAYQLSYEVAVNEPQRYQQMASQAEQQMQAFASVDAVTPTLSTFLSNAIARTTSTAMDGEVPA